MYGSFKAKSNKLLYWQQSWAYTHSHRFLSPFPLYMEMKRSFMLFPLVALFIAVWRFISWFHLRFRRLFLGKPLKCVSDSKQSFSPLSLTCSSRLLSHDKPPSQDFQSELSHTPKPKSIQYCPKEGRCCSCSLADMKGEQRILFVISLISIISAVWMNFKWLAWSYLCYHRSNMNTILCSVLETVAFRMRWVPFEERRCVSDSATRWWSYSWFGMRLTGSGSGEGSRYHWKIWEIWWCLKPHNHILKQICSIPVFMNITKLHTPSENLWLHLHITNLPVSYCQLLPVKAQVCSEGNKERGQSQRDPVQQGSRNNFNILKGHSWYLWIVVWLVNYTLFDSVDMYIIRPLN